MAALLLFISCTEQDAEQQTPAGFELLTGDETGLTFRNDPQMDEVLNVFSYMYFYNGGGLAAGDFNNDGLPDLYFTANRDDNALFLNEGNLQFRDVTVAAGIAGQDSWTTGASVVDINQDGWLDIYVTQVSGYAAMQGFNQLYLNQGADANGVPAFREAAAEYGLDQVGFGTQAVFLDYDGDGDLDCFQLNHSVHQNGTFGPRERFDQQGRHPLAGDRLLRNDGLPDGVGGGGFTDVSVEAGIIGTALGYGLGVSVGDINNDGWPDIYVGNDFHENDYLYLNQQNGTFREVLTERLRHTSRFTMGVDMADLNNDGYTDIFSLDMLPEDPVILKQSLAEDGFDVFRFKLGFGYNPQFSRNTLQFNNGDGTFSEIAARAGVHATDWSWGPLFFDMNDDGFTDLFVSNGIPRRMNDIDWINFKTQDNSLPGTEPATKPSDELEYVAKMPQIKLYNKFFQNDRHLHFTDLSQGVTGAATSYSNSAVFVDLDLDGDLDIVTNNIEDYPYIYRNQLREGGGKSARDSDAYLNVELVGPDKNLNAIGASVVVFSGNGRQRVENHPARGFQSSALGPLHIGLGDSTTVDSMLLIWPDGTYTRLDTSRYNRTVTATYATGLPKFDYTSLGKTNQFAPLADETAGSGIKHSHTENQFVDFNREPLIPHMVSTEGPGLAVGDLNGDGLDDFFVGSSKYERSALYFQNPAGRFTSPEVPAIEQDSIYEDVDAAFADLDNDGDLDLIVAAGGNEFEKQHLPRKQRTYLNDGAGNFTRTDVLNGVYATASRVLPMDFDGDGLVDLVVTGRVVPNDYGRIPRSYLFRNRGELQFQDVTEKLAPGLASLGRITDAKWADLDGDEDPDLVVAVEWGHVAALMNTGANFSVVELSDRTGWWSCVEVADVDGDGDLDVLAGNFGTNNKLQPTVAHPVRLYVNDFDHNGREETVLTYYVQGREIPFANYAELLKQLPYLKKKFIYARDFARATPQELFGADAWRQARIFSIETMESMLFEQAADGHFRSKALPDRLQWSSIHAIQKMSDAADKTRFLVGGNFHSANIEMGWYDAGRLSVLTIDKQLRMEVNPIEGEVSGQVRRLSTLDVGSDRPAYLVAFNNDSLRLFR
ncbi:VCBS repeat-containing protein [Neolewinella xylanilytica]|uniref:VCBS repeat-containing protein n=1 Tax=Neolewinella xylanilytica TaxID=1514080 RepID=UPI001473C126|nr:VCBS repeat-containing protein [Neolewinella xylanilytica]